jgi:hypothetical protein
MKARVVCNRTTLELVRLDSTSTRYATLTHYFTPCIGSRNAVSDPLPKCFTWNRRYSFKHRESCQNQFRNADRISETGGWLKATSAADNSTVAR